MDSLRRLATEGIAKFGPGRLASEASSCWDYMEATGDGRFATIARVLCYLAEGYDDDSNHVFVETTSQLDAILRRHLPGILDASTADEGAILARLFREAIESVSN